MSVQQEHLQMSTEQAGSQSEEAPKLEVASPNESLEAFGAALGGALLGMLATLLLLAIFNNGTLSFTNAESESLEANLVRIDENLGAVNHNVEVLAGQLSTLESSLVDLDTTLAAQGVHLEEIDETLVELEGTRQNFDIFTAALAEALSEMNATGAESETEGSGATVETADVETADRGTAPAVVTGDDLPANAVQALLFVDENGNGILDDDETALVGASVTLSSADGEELSASTTDTGAIFEELAPGEYTVTVEDSMGYTLADDASTTVTIEQDGAGQSVHFAVEPTQ